MSLKPCYFLRTRLNQTEEIFVLQHQFISVPETNHTCKHMKIPNLKALERKGRSKAPMECIK